LSAGFFYGCLERLR